MKSVVARSIKLSVGSAAWHKVANKIKAIDHAVALSPFSSVPNLLLDYITPTVGENISKKSFIVVGYSTLALIGKDLWSGSGTIGLLAFVYDVGPFLIWELLNILQDWKDLQTRANLERLCQNRASWTDPNLRELMEREEMALFSNNIAIGSNMLISHAVDIAHGWPSTNVTINLAGGYQSAKYHNTPAFEEHVAQIAHDSRQSNKPRVMMLNFPVVGTDRNDLVLNCARTDWATFRFPRVQSDWPDVRSNIAASYFHNDVIYPNSLTLHLIVKTSDNKYVLAKVSKGNAGDLPGWALTLGEQFDPDDIELGADAIRKCCLRGLHEELGIYETDKMPQLVLPTAPRVMAVNFEYLSCNFTLITVAQISWTFADVLRSFSAIERMPKDREASVIRGIDPSELSSIVKQTTDLHFSTPIRAACAMIYEGQISRLLSILIDGKGKA